MLLLMLLMLLLLLRRRRRRLLLLRLLLGRRLRGLARRWRGRGGGGHAGLVREGVAALGVRGLGRLLGVLGAVLVVAVDGIAHRLAHVAHGLVALVVVRE